MTVLFHGALFGFGLTLGVGLAAALVGLIGFYVIVGFAS
jgi:hypothetical protein